jgi:hypothetical protein
MKRLALVALTVFGSILYLDAAPAWAQNSGTSRSSTDNSSSGAGGKRSKTHSSATTGPKSPSDVLARNTKLSAKIANLTGTSAQSACSGFRNLGQCVATAHVSKNLGIKFTCLKARMLGIAHTDPACRNTSSKTMTLGQAIRALAPKANARAELKRANQQARADMDQTSS